MIKNPNWQEATSWLFTKRGGVESGTTRKQIQSRSSKVLKTFRAQIAICEPTNHLFWNADLLTCFHFNKKQIGNKI